METKSTPLKSSKPLSDSELQALVLQLPTALSPGRDLWTGIEKAISGKSQKGNNQHHQWHKSSVTWVASVIAAVLLTWGVIVPQDTLQHILSGKTQANINLVATMEQTFKQQKKLMRVSYGQPKFKELALDMQEPFKQLTSAQVIIKKALTNEPHNIDLLNLLRWTQQQELDLMKQLYSPQWQAI
jgi:hypothetical protein